jgi:chromosome segregation ATPase
VLQKRVLSELQSKLDQSNSEREMLKRANAEIQRELADLKSNVAEKDSQIEQLTQEGLKLSKQELTQSNIIKKLRTKEKESEEVLNILK